MEFYQNYDGQVARKGAITLFVILTLIVIAIAIVWIVYRIKKTDLSSVVIQKTPVKLFDMNDAVVFDSANIPATLNGQEFAYSFWLYLADFKMDSSNFIIFYRGQEGGAKNPVVMMDKSTNKMYINIRTNAATVQAVIDYVPLQRWVHIAFVVSDNMLTVYMDGDMYTVENVLEKRDPTTSNRPIFLGTTGDVVIGKMKYTSPSGVRGYVGRIEFFNYALTKTDVLNAYKMGPSDNTVLAKMGLPSFGVRSPIYRIDS